MRSLKRIGYSMLLLMLLLSACAPVVVPAEQSAAAPRDWQPADLRILDPLDSPASTQDLIAGYLRFSGQDFQIRLDLFKNEDPLDYDVFIALDILPGGGQALPFDGSDGFDWDILLKAPAGQMPGLTLRDGLSLPDARPRVVRDAFLDCIILSLPDQLLSGVRRIRVLAWITSPDGTDVLDTIGPFRWEDASPARAPLLLEFWDSLPAGTPALLLRRWDGAHTGPYGQRHGLRYLLGAAQSNRVPLTLLDLAQPASVRGLQRVGGLDLVRQMQFAGLLSLPDNGYALPAFAPLIAAFDRRVAGEYGLHAGGVSFGYAPAGGAARLAYAVLKDATHIQQFQGARFIPIRYSLAAPDETVQDETIDQNGLTTEAVRRLLETALSRDPADLVVLGDSLPASPWGDLSVSQKAMRYIAGHPWIQPLSIADLATFPALPKQGLHEVLACADDALCLGSAAQLAVLTPYGQLAASQIDSRDLAGQIYRSLSASQTDIFIDSAIEMLAARTLPTGDARQANLNASALAQAGFLVEASRWNHNPNTQAQCEADLDWDGFAECILSDETFFAILDPEGGRLAFAAARSNGQAYPLIGPTALAAAGQSDLAELPGAFADPAGAIAIYTVQTGAGKIVMEDSQSGIQRTFALRDGRLAVAIHNDQPSSQAPVFLSGLDQQEFAIAIQADRLDWSLSADTDAELALQGAAIRSTNTVFDALPLLRASENPDLSYPSGHYIPFPFLILDIQAGSDWSVTISLN